MDGESVVGIRGTLPASDGTTALDVVYVSRSSRPLPVLVILSRKASPILPAVSSRVKLSNWGEHLTLTPPADAIPASKL